MTIPVPRSSVFSFTATATPVIYPLSLHDALPILDSDHGGGGLHWPFCEPFTVLPRYSGVGVLRSEEHTSELQSPYEVVCGLLLVKMNEPMMWLPSKPGWHSFWHSRFAQLPPPIE